ncbi:MAG: helix-turn-helix transcriptional regulator [Syntrophaceticus sp.]|nr:helix-turn-helix transcriptional regulator [Syntrophaceticus sp.]MDD3315027.1 helix-turn-helix transcriptional regulator [Syntrophaceticus sp.]MDD4359687.1 helix-turn-helix transcriptional regulator [Syntrophaceticus sp.]MDD4782969.1 helix-turn-helix transcriptional regulator [Syntrophaceticus sp.]
MNEFYRIGDKLVSMEKLYRSLTEMLTLRSTGVSQQEVADRCGVDRTFLSRLENLGSVRKGKSIAVIGFPLQNKEELISLLDELGVEFRLLMTDDERWRFVTEKSGLELVNEVMGLAAKSRTCDVVILIGSRQRINWCAALLDKEVLGIDLGESPIEKDKYLDPKHLRKLIISAQKSDR